MNKQSTKKVIGSMYIQKNHCCKDKPINILVSDEDLYTCECACGTFCTNSWISPTEAIMEYELGEIYYNTENIYKVYKTVKRRMRFLLSSRRKNND